MPPPLLQASEVKGLSPSPSHLQGDDEGAGSFGPAEPCPHLTQRFFLPGFDTLNCASPYFPSARWGVQEKHKP